MKHLRGPLTEDEWNWLLAEEQDPEFLNLPKRLTKRITVDKETGCWLVSGWNDGKGHAKFRINITVHYVHRVVYEWVWGFNKSDGDCIHHVCYNANCCNPEHLEHATVSENTKDFHDRLKYLKSLALEIDSKDIPF